MSFESRFKKNDSEKPDSILKKLKVRAPLVALSIFAQSCALPETGNFDTDSSLQLEKDFFIENNIGNLEKIREFGEVKFLIEGDKYLVIIQQVHHNGSSIQSSSSNEIENISKVQNNISNIIDSLSTKTYIAEGFFHESTSTVESIKEKKNKIESLIDKYFLKKHHSSSITLIEDIINIVSDGKNFKNKKENNLFYQDMLLVSSILSDEKIDFLAKEVVKLKNNFFLANNSFFIEFSKILISKNNAIKNTHFGSNYSGAYFKKWLNGDINLLSAGSTATTVKAENALSTNNKKDFEKYALENRENEVLDVANNYFLKNPKEKNIPVVFGYIHNWENNVNEFNQQHTEYKMGLITIKVNGIDDVVKDLKK